MTKTTKAQQIREMFLNGSTRMEIAKVLDTPYSHVHTTIKKMKDVPTTLQKEETKIELTKVKKSERSDMNEYITKLEEAILRGACFNEFNDCREGWGTWTFTVIDNSGLDGKTASGVISSLVKKGLASVSYEKGENDMFDLTAAGIEMTKTWTE